MNVPSDPEITPIFYYCLWLVNREPIDDALRKLLTCFTLKKKVLIIYKHTHYHTHTDHTHTTHTHVYIKASKLSGCLWSGVSVCDVAQGKTLPGRSSRCPINRRGDKRRKISNFVGLRGFTKWNLVVSYPISVTFTTFSKHCSRSLTAVFRGHRTDCFDLL